MKQTGQVEPSSIVSSFLLSLQLTHGIQKYAEEKLGFEILNRRRMHRREKYLLRVPPLTSQNLIFNSLLLPLILRVYLARLNYRNYSNVFLHNVQFHPEGRPLPTQNSFYGYSSARHAGQLGTF